MASSTGSGRTHCGDRARTRAPSLPAHLLHADGRARSTVRPGASPRRRPRPPRGRTPRRRVGCAVRPTCSHVGRGQDGIAPRPPGAALDFVVEHRRRRRTPCPRSDRACACACAPFGRGRRAGVDRGFCGDLTGVARRSAGRDRSGSRREPDLCLSLRNSPPPEGVRQIPATPASCPMP